MRHFLFIFGTRPEAIKLAPLIKRLKKQKDVKLTVCVTAQHRQMLDQVLELFGIIPDVDLNLMKPGQALGTLSADILTQVGTLLDTLQPNWVVVQGDTTTAFAAALAAFYQKVPIAHIEAGLRTGDFLAPFPEEMNRSFIGKMATLHFAPTCLARNNLLKEGVPQEKIHVTGNTVIDALLETRNTIAKNQQIQNILEKQFCYLDPFKKTILVTGHRRENFGKSFEDICESLKILGQREDLQIVYPVHLNPKVQEPVHRLLGGHPRIFLIDPLDYLPFVYLMDKAYVILTDSGGVQEEAPSLGKPVVVMRDVTERQEGVEAGTAVLAGTEKDKIVKTVDMLLDNLEVYDKVSRAHNPYGDGISSAKIMEILLKC